MVLSIAKEARSTFIADLSKTSPNKRDGKNKWDNSMLQSEDKVCVTQPICHESRQGK